VGYAVVCRGEAGAWDLAGDALGVFGVVNVGKLREHRYPQAPGGQPAELGAAGIGAGHRDAEQQRRVRGTQAE
jgi:hypothetical protein